MITASSSTAPSTLSPSIEHTNGLTSTFQNILVHLDADSKQAIAHSEKYRSALKIFKSTCTECLSLFEPETKHASSDRRSTKSNTLEQAQTNVTSLTPIFFKKILTDLTKFKSVDENSPQNRVLNKLVHICDQCLSHAKKEAKSANSKPPLTGSVISKTTTTTPENRNSTNTSLKTEHIQKAWEKIHVQLAENLKQAMQCLNQARNPRKQFKGCFATQKQLKQDVDDLISTIELLNGMLHPWSPKGPRQNKNYLEDLKPLSSHLEKQINSIECCLKRLEDEQNMITDALTTLLPLTRDILKSTDDKSDIERLENTGIL